MRNAARARILRKRAAAAPAKWNQTIVGRKVRVIRKAKRDCRVTDAKRKSMGAYLFLGEGVPFTSTIQGRWP